MAFDQGLAERLREVLRGRLDVDEKHMFGGIVFMAHGYMAVGIVGDVLMVRVGPVAYPAALKQRHARPMDFTGKPLAGYLYIDPPGFAEDDDLARWVALALDFVDQLPPKLPKAPKPPKAVKAPKPGKPTKPTRPR